jgi:hypothetical protein
MDLSSLAPSDYEDLCPDSWTNTLERAASPELDPTDPEGMLHGFLPGSPVTELPWWEHEEAAESLAELTNAMAMEFPGTPMTVERVKAQLRLEAAEAAGPPPCPVCEDETSWGEPCDECWRTRIAA